MIILFILLFIASCAHTPYLETPSWVEGVRSGEESLRVTNGGRVFYRRILKKQNETSDETCSMVLKMVQEDLQNESAQGVSIPFTLDYLFFDKDYDECAVTISVSGNLLKQMMSLKSMQEKFNQEREKRSELEKNIKSLELFIFQNKHLVEKLSNLNAKVEVVRHSIAENRDRVKQVYLTGMSVKQFTRLTGVPPIFQIDTQSRCWDQFKTSVISHHGNLLVCWAGSQYHGVIRGICEMRSGHCFVRDP